MGELLGNKKKMLKELIEQLHAGVSPNEVKEKFTEVLKGIGAKEISQIEEQLIKEGMPSEEIHRLCDVHLAVFKESLEKQKVEVPLGHPIYILLKEHEFVKGVIEEISSLNLRMEQTKWKKLEELLQHIKEYDKHKIREENCLFPYLEKHGVTHPPAVMWAEHDEQRKDIKEALNILKNKETFKFEEFKAKLLPHLENLTSSIPNHFYKEENILFPTALRLIKDEEWREIKAAMDDLGYCYFTPKDAIGEKEELLIEVKKQEGEITFETGSMKKEELEAVLNTLPVDITFVDKEDTVRYFSQTKERVFARTKAVIGRKVQQCHPQNSIHVVSKILDDFKKGRRDVAEFWIQIEERLIYIRYFPVRKNDEYIGTLEVTQDITDIKKIEGEKKLLD